MKRKLIIPGVSILVILLLVVGVTWTKHAFGSVFITRGCFVSKPMVLSSSTTTLSYMTAGKATTTLTCDTYALGGSAGKTNAADSAILTAILYASTTGTIVNINQEFSNDGNTWFQNNTGDVATTSPVLYLDTVQTMQWAFSTSTEGLSGATTIVDATTTKAVTIKTPTRYTRIIFSIPIGAKAGAIWAELAVKKQN